jgi:type III secretion protein N (ATPase)
LFSTGVRALDGLLTVGRGQRLGIFAPAGVGKSTLIGMVTRNCESDVNVVALIGERGREVNEFIEKSLGDSGLARSIIVTATSDRPAIERIKAAFVAMTLAEYFRNKGKNVFLVMDSITRFARALREIGLAGGEPPTRRGYPPSVFAVLPRLLERAGRFGQGSITFLTTVLLETEDDQDPIGEEVRSILDGHIVLSKKLAASGHFPPIDILRSTSRTMDFTCTQNHIDNARSFRALMGKYEEIELLLQVGEYAPGRDRAADDAVKRKSHMDLFLKQSVFECVSIDRTKSLLAGALQGRVPTRIEFCRGSVR